MAGKSEAEKMRSENLKLRRKIDKLEKDVKKYKKQSLLMRDKINDLQYHIRGTKDEGIIKDLADLKRHCPTKTSTMGEIEEEEGKIMYIPPEDEPEMIEVTYFCVKRGKEVTELKENPKAKPKKFTPVERIR